MAPKKQQKQKMALGDFLADETLGSWADEMDSLPTAPAARAPDDAPSDRFGRSGGGFGGDRDFSSRPDRGPSGPPREDLPLPTAPPYTVFVGNLAFDLVEDDLAAFFAPESLKSVKVIRDREEKPKGFGYVEFDTLAGLKNGLIKSGTQLNSRTIRVSVAEPPKEREQRSGFGGFDNDAANWRRDGPPAAIGGGGGGRSRFDDRPPREPTEPSVADTASDWRSSRPARVPPPEEPPRRSGSGFRDAPPRTDMTWERKGTLAEHVDRPSNFRRGSGFNTPSGERESAPLGAAETDDVWARGPPRAAAQPEDQQAPKRGAFGGRGGDGPQIGTTNLPDTGDWRSQMKSPAARQGSTDKSPTTSQPPTPQGNRKRLELLPRSQTGSNVASPLSSPRMNPAPASKANPFGAAKPIDVTAKDREVAEKLEKDRESRIQNKPAGSNPFGNARPSPMSRQGSTSGPPTRTEPTPRDGSPSASAEGDKEKEARAANKFDSKAAQVRSQTSFAAAAGKKDDVKEVTDKVAEVTV